MSFKRLVTTVAALAAVVMAAGNVPSSAGSVRAGAASAHGMAAQANITVCASVLSTDISYYAGLLKAYELAGAKLGLNVIGLNANSDSQTLANQFNDCVARHAKAIIATPVNAATLKSVAKATMKKGVAVIIQGEEPSEVSWASADVGYSEQSMGTLIGQLCASCLLQKYPSVSTFEVGVCSYPTLPATIIRMAAAKDAVVKNAKGHKVVFDFEQPCGTQQTGYTVTTAGRTAHPNVRAMIGVNDDSSIGALKAFQAKGVKPSTLCLAGTNNDLDVRPYVKNGQIYGTVDLNANGLAVAAMHLAQQAANGQKLPGMTYVSMIKVTQHNES
jgi:ABC-type sugar transport system substrate-binding protein